MHATRDVAAGEELSIAYVELYAAGVDRRSQLQTKKFFQWYKPTLTVFSSPPSSNGETNGFVKFMQRCSVGVKDQGADEAL